jgi:hypothetical protein
MHPPSVHVGHVLHVMRALRHQPGLVRAWAVGTTWGWRDRRRFRECERFVFFVGHGFSGHSLLGSLLNAHPDVVVSHELDALKFVRSGFGRNQLFGLIRFRDLDWEERGRVQNAYSYVVPGQWQGRVRRLVAIGDKKGGVSTWHLADDPGLLHRLRAEVRLPLRCVYVTRSPLDNIGSMIKTMGYTLPEAVAIWRRQVETVASLREQLGPDELHVVSTEAVKVQPVACLRALCEFVGVEPLEDYLQACAALVRPEQSPSRDAVKEWPAAVLQEIRDVTAAHDFLGPYLADVAPTMRPRAKRYAQS